MRRDDRQRVTIEFGTDDSSLQRALRDIDQLRESLESLQGRGVGGGSQGFTGSAYQPPRPPNDFGSPGTPTFGGGGGGWQPFGNSGPMPFSGGWAPSAGMSMSGVSTVTLTNVATVNITATTVNVSGAGGGGIGGGGGGGIDPGAAVPGTGAHQAAQGAGPAYSRMPTTRTMIQGMLQGIGMEGFGAAAVGAFAQNIAAVAPYAIPAVGYGAFGSGITAAQAQVNRASDLSAQMGMTGASGGFVTPGQQLAQRMEMADVDRQGWMGFGKGLFLYQGLDFITAGSLTRWNMEIDRTKQISPQAADMRAKMRLVDYLGGPDYTKAIPTFKEAMENNNLDRHLANNEIQGGMASLGTISNASAIRLTMSGMTGLQSVIKNLSGDSMIADSQLSGMMQGINTLTPTGRARAYFGKTTEEDKLNAAWGNIFNGNWGSEAQSAVRMMGGTTEGMSSYAMSLAQSQEDAMSAQLSAQMAMSYSQEMLARGRGAKVASQSMLSGADALMEEIDALRVSASLTPNELEKKKIKSQIASLEATAATQRKTAYYMPYAQDISVAGSRASQAGAETQIFSYGGGSAYRNPGFEAGATAFRQSREALLALKGSAWWSTANPDEKAQVEAQISQSTLQITEQYRSQSFAMYGETSSAIGLSRAGLSGAAAYASLTSSPGEAFGAQSKLLQSNEDLIRNERLLLERGNLSLAERNQHLTTIVQLQNEIKIGTEQNLRTLYGGEMGVLGAQIGGTTSRGAREAMLGGSLAAFGSQAGAVGLIRQQITTAERELQRRISAGESGQSIEDMRAQIEQLKTQETQGTIGLSMYSPSPRLEMAGTMNSMYLSSVTRTFAGYGDVRKGLYQGMEIVGHKLQELETQKNKALAEAKPEQRDAILNYYAQQASPLFNEAIGYQQALESGWQERLFSQVIGGGGNYDVVASRFTHRESSMFGGISNRFFGGNYQQMSHYRREAPMWYQSFARSIGRPEGFMDTATEGMASGGKIDLGGTINLNITVQDSAGHKLTNTQEQVNVNNQALDATFKKHKGQMP